MYIGVHNHVVHGAESLYLRPPSLCAPTQLLFVRKGMDPYHRRRALAALQLFGVPDLSSWFHRLGITQRELNEGGGYASLNVETDPPSSSDDEDDPQASANRPSIRSAQLLVWKKAGWGPYKLNPIFTRVKVQPWQQKWLAKRQGDESSAGPARVSQQARVSSPVTSRRRSGRRPGFVRRRQPSPSAAARMSLQSSSSSRGDEDDKEF